MIPKENCRTILKAIKKKLYRILCLNNKMTIKKTSAHQDVSMIMNIKAKTMIILISIGTIMITKIIMTTVIIIFTGKNITISKIHTTIIPKITGVKIYYNKISQMS
jgi:hypothetical protein